MNRPVNAVGNPIPAYQLASHDVDGVSEAESGRSTDPAMGKNRACITAIDGSPYDKGAPAKGNVSRANWRWDIRTDKTHWSEQLYRIIGWENPTIPPFREHFRFYTSESWIRLVDATLELLKTGTPYELRLQMLHTDGSRRWVIRKGKPVDNEQGEIVELRGTVQDVTDSATQPGKPEPCVETESNAEDATRRLIQAQEEENARLVIKFHASICQRLALLSETIERFKSALSDLPRLSDTQIEPDAQIEPLSQETAGTLDELDLPEAGRAAASGFND
jgi:PAS fold